MEVTLKFYAVCRDLAKTGSAQLTLGDNPTKEDLWKTILIKYPGLKKASSNVALAVNNSYVAGELNLQDGDTVSLIPPVSGG